MHSALVSRTDVSVQITDTTVALSLLIKAVSSSHCATCGRPETVGHYLLTCLRYLGPRHALRKAVGRDFSQRAILGNPKHRAALLRYVEATGRFGAYMESRPS